MRGKRSMAARALLGALGVLALLYGAAYLLTPWSQLARTIVWLVSDVEDYKRFPSRRVENRPPVFRFSEPSADNPYSSVFRSVSYSRAGQLVVDELDRFLRRHSTTAFLVIKDDVLLYEKYFNGYGRDSIQTSFSMAKAFVSALVGVAIAEGYIGDIDDPVTKYIPELRDRDARFERITIRHLVTMSSGIRYVERSLPWSDDTTTYYAPNLRAAALKTDIAGEPGREFLYNNYNPLLLGIILERATGQSVSRFLQEKIWKPLGMEAPGSWSLDSTRSGFEKMESGLNARAIDFAKFGRLYLYKGNWNGLQVIPEAWVEESTRVDVTTDPSLYYQYFWWVAPGFGREHHFSAQGKYGQFIYVIPEQNLVMARFGRDEGGILWESIFQDLALRIRHVDSTVLRPSRREPREGRR
jgi:CubicO group peptidase (beta-lactamase class C family)